MEHTPSEPAGCQPRRPAAPSCRPVAQPARARSARTPPRCRAPHPTRHTPPAPRRTLFLQTAPGSVVRALLDSPEIIEELRLYSGQLLNVTGILNTTANPPGEPPSITVVAIVPLTTRVEPQPIVKSECEGAWCGCGCVGWRGGGQRAWWPRCIFCRQLLRPLPLPTCA